MNYFQNFAVASRNAKTSRTLKAYVKDIKMEYVFRKTDGISLNYTDRNLISFCQSVHTASCKVFSSIFTEVELGLLPLFFPDGT